jgi:hypothetical protein
MTDDTAACQKAIQAAVTGSTIYFPAGVYKLTDWLKMNHPPQVTLLGAGPSSVIHSAAGGGLMIGTGGEPGGPVTVRQLKFTGLPGATQRSGNSTGGIQIFGPANTVVDNCDFASVTSAVFDAAPTQGTVTKNCRILGWARIAFFAEKNAQILNCKVIQNDPNPTAQNTSHGVYIHGGASNVLVADCEFAGIAKYALQQYSEAPNTITSGVQMRRLYIHDCQNGIVFAHSQPGAGDIMNSLVDSCTITNITGGSAILIKDGDGVTISNNTVNGCVSYGIGVGGWAPYEQGFSLANVDIFGNTVENCQTGLFGLASNGGTFSNVRFHGNILAGNKQDLAIQSVLGLSYSPTAPKPYRRPAARGRPRASFTLQVGDTVTVNGHAFTVAVGTTLVPVAPAPVPPPPPPPPPPPIPVPVPGLIQVSGYRNAQRNPTGSVYPGQTLYIDGFGFGAPPGTVTVNNSVCPPLAWSDSEIEIVAPLLNSWPPGPVVLTVMSADKRVWTTSLAFTLLALPGSRQ